VRGGGKQKLLRGKGKFHSLRSGKGNRFLGGPSKAGNLLVEGRGGSNGKKKQVTSVPAQGARLPGEFYFDPRLELRYMEGRMINTVVYKRK